MVTNRLKPFVIDGKTVHQIGIPWHWGWKGVTSAGQQGRHHQRPRRRRWAIPTVYIQETEGLPLQREEGGGVAMARTLAMFTDISLCIGCRACQVACKQWNELRLEEPEWTGGYQNHAHFTDKTYPARALHREAGRAPTATWRWLLMSDVCKHCAQAGCLEACPTGAIYRTEYGTVDINQDVCNGCRYCVVVVPVRRGDASTTTTGTCHQVHLLQRPHPQRARARLRQGLPHRVHPVRLPRRAGRESARSAWRSSRRWASRSAQLYGVRLQRAPRRPQRVLPAAGQAVDVQPPGEAAAAAAQRRG